MTNTGWVLLGLTLLFWVLLNAVLNSVVGRQASGDAAMGLAIEWIYAVVLVFLTWASISGLLMATRGLPNWVSVAAMLIVPASGIAAFGAMYVVSETTARWPLMVPLVIPGLIAAYVFALSRPALQVTTASLPMSLAVWGAVIALSVAVAPPMFRRMEEKEQKRVERRQVEQRADAAEGARKREQGLEKLKAMTPDMPLTQWYDLLDPKNGVRQEALAALRQVERRQADVEELVAREIPFYMSLVPELDLKPTRALCDAAHKYLAFVARGKMAGGQEPYPYQADEYIDNSLTAVRWFTAHGCNCDDALTTIEGNIRKYYLDNGARNQILAMIKGLKQGQ